MKKLIYLPLIMSLSITACRYYMPAKQELDYCYLNPHKNLSNIGKVAFLELNNQTNRPQVSENLTNAMCQAVQKRQLFSLKLITKENPSFQDLRLNTNEVFSIKELLAMKNKLNCNAVLFGAMTDYVPYPHMTIGMKLKMVDLNDGQLIWAFEQIWDSADKATERRIERYFESNIRSDLTPLHEELMAVSPIKFNKFVAFEVAQTLK